MSRYEEDEFDRAARERGPRGVHRPVQPRWKRLLPYLVVIVAAPILAFATISILNKDNAPDPAADSTQTAEVTGEATATDVTEAPPGEEPPAEPAPEESAAEPEPEPEPDVRFDTTVVVLNGAGVQGIAGRGADRLESAGFTSTQAENYNRAEPANSTVYYANAELADTAAAVGEALGITNLVEDSAATTAIAVVLRGDYQE